MPGEIVEVSDYDTVEHRLQTTFQSAYFNDKYGRTDLKPIFKLELSYVVGYLIKYIEKDGGKLVYSRGLPQYIQTDVMSDDVICPMGLNDRKLLLFDDFNCWNDGELIGSISREVIEKMPKCN